MSDDLFTRLFELLRSPGPVNWELAGEVARSVAGPPEALDPRTVEEYRELTRLAQLRVTEAVGLELGPGLDASPVDRRSWAEANLRSFRYLVEPFARKLGRGASTDPSPGSLDAILQPMAPALLGLQIGAMVGFLSHRVLGQFDVGLPAVGGDPSARPAIEAGSEGGRSASPALFLVVPNVEQFAADYGLDPSQVRLWVALHEVTHQAEFARPWVREHFLALIDRYVEGMELDPAALGERLQRLGDPDELQRLMQDPAGLAGFFSGPAQREGLDAIQAFMAVIEGYGEHVMDRAAPQLLPDLSRMREAMTRRRAEASEGEQTLQRLLGLELKREQYRMGAAFCEEVARRWGEEALAELWRGPEGLPSLAELADPVSWAARVLLRDPSEG